VDYGTGTAVKLISKLVHTVV